MPKQWTPENVLALGRAYQPATVLAAAADLDVFSALSRRPLSAAEVARRLKCDPRGMAVLLDALAALRLLKKRGGRYAAARGVSETLTHSGRASVLAMAQHQATCLRRWTQLARVVKTGRPARRAPGIRGESGDAASFIGAMHNLAAPRAAGIIRAIKPLKFSHLLDVGGASGTWTMAFLRACPGATATLFDLPHVIPMARRRLAAAGLIERARLVAGDFYRNPLPGGADLAWVSAIVHQHSRADNLRLFRKVFRALTEGGRIALRDILMGRDRTWPVRGALFAVNMLVHTESGGTFTFDELREDLEAAGFTGVRLARNDQWMDSIVVATKPASARPARADGKLAKSPSCRQAPRL